MKIFQDKNLTINLEQLSTKVTVAVLNACWNEPPRNKTNKVACAPSEDWSAWASAQSDQSLRCPHEESLGL